MFRGFLGALWCFCCAVNLPVSVATSCDPTQYMCSARCPPLPEGVEVPTSEAFCGKDPESDTCICWLHNPSSQLHVAFQCEAKVNNSVSQIGCVPPSHCFRPDTRIGCLIVLRCRCLLFEHRYQHRFHSWKRVKALLHTVKREDTKQSGQSKEKIAGDVREFSLKHLFFLLGFVVAPLLCWCLLNFFHEGRCRKKPPRPPEAQQMPTSRSSTVDNMNNEEEDSNGEQGGTLRVPTPRSGCTSQDCTTIQVPTAPHEEDAAHQRLVKTESPPPYCETFDGNCPPDFGPPPTYEDAIRGSVQVWQTVLVLQPQVPASAPEAPP